MFEVKVIEDSVSQDNVRLTTMQLKYPRWILAELNTHRVFSRSTSSSRAIPVQKMIEMVRSEPAMPVHWGKNQSGMQAKEELTEAHLEQAKELWLKAASQAAETAEQMMGIGLHKQVANRVLEPFQWVSTVVTATEWENFYHLRTHPDAQPEIQKLAKMMLQAHQDSIPKLVKRGEWHLPYIQEELRKNTDPEVLTKYSAARCARCSYNKHDGSDPDIEDDLRLFNLLVDRQDKHASPLEHQATPDSPYSVWGNLIGWKQFRKLKGY